MEWYIPITILPGIGFLILSTANFIVSLNIEIKELEGENKTNYIIIKQKIKQLKKLSYSLIGQYIASFSLVIGGIVAKAFNDKGTTNYFVFSGVIILALSLVLLIVYSIKALKIRQEHLKIQL